MIGEENARNLKTRYGISFLKLHLSDIAGKIIGMGRMLFKVEHCFEIRNHGVVILPGIVPQGYQRFRVGDSLELRRPDGTAVITSIVGLEFMNPMPANHALAVVLPTQLTKVDVPVGTEVWSI